MLAATTVGLGACGSSGHTQHHARGTTTKPRRVFLLAHAAPVNLSASRISGHGSHKGLIAGFASIPIRGLNRAHALAESSKGQTVPLWGGTATTLGHTYDYVMVGADPFRPGSTSASVSVDVVPVQIEFDDPTGQAAYTFDPGAPSPNCGESASPAQLLLQSPIFQPSSYTVGGVNVGTVQYPSAFLREEFARQALGPRAPDPGYGISLNATGQPEIGVKVPYGDWQVLPASETGACGGTSAGDIGMVNVNSWDSYVKQSLVGQLQAAGEAASTHLLDFLFSNVVMTDGSAVIAGYHSGVPSPSGVQYYASAIYGPPGLAHGTAEDVASMAHEVGEWLNDPDGMNGTPAWGHIGQVASCQADLEVGDPLAGTTVAVTMPNGMTYHPQELAFASWFYRQRPSPSINGWYSSNGTFKVPQRVCAG